MIEIARRRSANATFNFGLREPFAAPAGGVALGFLLEGTLGLSGISNSFEREIVDLVFETVGSRRSTQFMKLLHSTYF